ncbi:MAG: DUF2283 domain-containing protein [Patescibacteria group bacterium]
MKINYDKTADAVYISIKKGAVKKTARLADLVLADLDKNGKVLGVEILGASVKFSKKTKSLKSIFNIPVSITA